MEDRDRKLADLEQKLRSITHARELNKKIRDNLRRRLAVVDAEIFIAKSKAESPFLYYKQTEIWGISNQEVQSLVQIFWGKNRVETNREIEKTGQRAEKLSKLSQMTCFVNSFRTARQRCLMVQQNDPSIKVKSMFMRPSLTSLDLRFATIDAIRFIVMTSVFGKEIQIQRVYPGINVSKVTCFVQQALKRSESAKPLTEYGEDPDGIQQRITECLKSVEVCSIDHQM